MTYRLYKVQKSAQLLDIVRKCSKKTEGKLTDAPRPDKIATDMIGPPDPVSNLRKIIFKIPPNETFLEKRLRETKGEVQEWNFKFWTDHNSRFFEERENYIKNNLPEGRQNLTADEMSVFYKSFLDKNWKSHVSYNIEWYKRNIYLLVLDVKVRLCKLLRIKNVK